VPGKNVVLGGLALASLADVALEISLALAVDTIIIVTAIITVNNTNCFDFM